MEEIIKLTPEQRDALFAKHDIQIPTEPSTPSPVGEIIEAEFTEIPADTTEKTLGYMEVVGEVDHSIESATVSSINTETAVSDDASPLRDLNVAVDAEDSVVYAEYNLDDVNKYIEHIDSLNFIELTSLKSNTASNLKAVEDIRNVVDSVANMKLDDSINRSMVQVNVLKSNGIDGDVNEFLTNYDENTTKMKLVIEAVDTAMKKYEDRKQGTMFFTEQMIEILDKKMANLPEDHPEYAQAKVRYCNGINAFTNRSDFSFIAAYIKKTVENKRTMRNFTKALKGSSVPFYETDIQKSLSKEQMQRVHTYLRDVLEIPNMECSFLYFVLGRIVKNESANGKDNYVRVFVLNILDTVAGEYDYWQRPGSDETEDTLPERIRALLYKPVV